MKKILVIDDDSDIRFLLEKVLTHEGYTPIMATNGEEGLALFEDCDLVLLDMTLPGISGMDVAHTIRAKKGPSFPLIALTGKPLEELQQGLFTAHCLKPFHYQDLAALLKKVLS